MKALIVSNLERGFSAGHLSMIGPLQELGYEVTWASNFSEFRGDISSFPCRTVQIDFVRHPLHPGNLKAYRQLTRLMREEDFRLVHCNSPVGGVLGRICGARAGVPTILYTVHGFHFYKGAPPVNRVVYRSVEILLARHTDALITINHEDYEAAKRFRLRNGGKAYRIPGIGVDTKAVERAVPKRAELLNQIGADDSSVVLISVGELNENKTTGRSSGRSACCGIAPSTMSCVVPAARKLGWLSSRVNSDWRATYISWDTGRPSTSCSSPATCSLCHRIARGYLVRSWKQ